MVLPKGYAVLPRGNAVLPRGYAVLPRGYAVLPRGPEASLCAMDLTALEKSMAEEMPLGSECKLKFAGIHFRPGMLVVDTVNKN